ncbi:hypothetical protein JIQ42_06260 [Leishmania sp. Namibia]|uniref:hypothetical protein n=1 Tax=Leishmania sp. Namibia TaxID=2802991 RepID=UPI001B71F8B7|nr:hypothetical protein JIQ42_06260 [Leishmania sp. Namibia]
MHPIRACLHSCGAPIALLPAMMVAGTLAAGRAAASPSTPAFCSFETLPVGLPSLSGPKSRGAAAPSAPGQYRSTSFKTVRRRRRNHAAQVTLRGGIGLGSGLLRATRVCYERDIVRNTLADTPSGYIQDPRAHPAAMPRYDSVSRIGTATLEAMDRERELLEREDLAYPGFTTLRIQELKHIVVNKASTKAELQHAVDALREELSALREVVGQEVEKPISTQRLLLLKWQQRQQRLQGRESAFQVSRPSTPAFRVVTQADGTEVIERPGRDTPRPPVHETDDAYLSQAVEAEELSPEALIPEKTIVTTVDVNHVRYLLGLTYRRLEQYDEAEQIFYDILADDVTNVDAVESLLELNTGIEGWTPRIRVLLDYLDTQYTKAVEEGRLPPACSPSKDPAVNAPCAEERRVAQDPDPAATLTPSLQPSSSPLSSSVYPADAVSTAAGANIARTPTPGYTMLPRVAPVEVALSLLSDLIVEAAAHKCSTDGEGAASRFFIEALGPIVRALGRDYGCDLLESLFRAVDEQHFAVRFDSKDMSPDARKFALSLVIAFLKALMARRIHEMLPESTRFHFFTLVKLHAALRSAGRVHESYKICEQLMGLYRAHSSVYRARVGAASNAALRSSPLPAMSPSPFGVDCSNVLRASAALRTGATAAEVGVGRAAAEASAPRSPAADPSRALAAAPERAVEEAPAAESRRLSEPPDVLDDQDANYREAFFQYVNDRAHDSPALGRRLCMEAMAEFPLCAAPWETLALLIHKEDPKRNLGDAIIAARRAMELEPFNVRVIVTLANFYKAAHRYELYDRMMDRYRLMSYMVEEGASEADMVATAAEIAALEEQTPRSQDLVEEMGRPMKEFLERMEQATTYSMPIDKEPRAYQDGPIRFIAQQPDMRPAEVEARDEALRRQRRMIESPQQR